MTNPENPSVPREGHDQPIYHIHYDQQPQTPQYQQAQYQQTQYQQAQYRQPVYAEAPPRGLSIASMAIGIASFFFGFTVVVPLVGLVLGFMGLRREPAGHGFALAGIWINGIILVLGAIVLVIILVAIAGIGAFTIPFISSTTSEYA